MRGEDIGCPNQDCSNFFVDEEICKECEWLKNYRKYKMQQIKSNPKYN